MGDTLITKPMKRSAQKIDLDGIPMEEIVVLEPLALSVPDVSLDSRRTRFLKRIRLVDLWRV